MNIIVPKTIEAAKERLAAIAETRRLTGWERAAIIWAHTGGSATTAGNRTDLEPVSDETGSRSEMAETLGVSVSTIARARKAWKDAKAPDIKPGDAIPAWVLALPYPPAETLEQKRVHQVAYFTAMDPEVKADVVVEAIKTVPEVVKAIALDHVARQTIIREVVRQTTPVIERLMDIEPRTDYDEAVIKALDVISDALLAEAKGLWTPLPRTVEFMEMVPVMFQRRGPDDTPALIAEVEAFLAERASTKEV